MGVSSVQNYPSCTDSRQKHWGYYIHHGYDERNESKKHGRQEMFPSFQTWQQNFFTMAFGNEWWILASDFMSVNIVKIVKPYPIKRFVVCPFWRWKQCMEWTKAPLWRNERRVRQRILKQMQVHSSLLISFMHAWHGGSNSF